MKTREELNALKEEVETIGKKLNALTEEELMEVSGGIKVSPQKDDNGLLDFVNWFFKIGK